MKLSKKRHVFAPFSIIIILILQFSFLLSDNSLGTPVLAVPSFSDVAWNLVHPLTITDDVQSGFWDIRYSGDGNIAIDMSDDYLNKKAGDTSLKITSQNGVYRYFDICHKYEGNQNFYMRSVFVFWWYGNGTDAKFRLYLYTPDAENGLYYDFYDDFSGWRQFVLYFDTNFTRVGRVNLSLLKEIHISLETANVQGTWYLDDVIADIVSLPTPETYLVEYEWSLNTLLEHRDEESKQVLAGWGASNDSRDYEDLCRFDLTLPTFTEAYKITGNKTYLEAAREAFDGAINYLYNPQTQLFSTYWNSTSKTYVDKLEILWGAITVNSMYDFYSVFSNKIYLTYANNFARALYVYGINHTTNLPHRSISVTNGTIISPDARVPLEIERLIGAYIKGYEVTSLEAFKVWAKDLTQAFWAKRNPTTNLVPLSISSNGTVVMDFCEPNFDPIQNVLLYAYEVTNDDFYLSLAVNLTDAQLFYAWSYERGRTLRAVWTDGCTRQSFLDLIDGPQIYIVALLQLFQYASIDMYLTYAESLWNTIHSKALVNDLYVTRLNETNYPNDVSDIYTQQMMVQCDAYLFHLTKNQTYLDDLKSTVNSFLLYYKMPYGFCYSVNTTSYEPISDNTLDWLDSSSYTLGAAIYACSVYSMQTTTTVEADLTYYVPYYPMFKIKGSLNYANNQICFNISGTSSCLNLTFTLPEGRVASNITVDGSSFFLYVENTSQLFLWDPGAYSVTVTMTSGSSLNVTVEKFDFSYNRLTVTVAATNVVNVAMKLHIPFNETSQTPFWGDAWDVDYNETRGEDNWDPINRILTVLTTCKTSTTIRILNLPPKAVELHNIEEITEDSMKLMWNESTARDFARYEVYMSLDGKSWKLIQSITEKSNTTYRLTGLSQGTTYHFFILVADTGELFSDSQQISDKTRSTMFPWVLSSVILVLFVVTTTLALIARRKLSKSKKQTAHSIKSFVWFCLHH